MGDRAAPGKRVARVACAQRVRAGFGEDLAKVGGDGKVATFVELLIGKAGPAAVDAAAANLPTEDEHDVAVPVVSAAGAVLAGSAAELRHGDDGDVFGFGAYVLPEGSDGFRELFEAAGEAALGAALGLVGVPIADVSKGGFERQDRP